jgi:hypothetical protein
MPLAFENGKILERKVEEILKSSKVWFRSQPLLVMNLRADFIVIDKYNNNWIVEVSLRNSFEDLQRLCFRSIVYKQFIQEKLKTITILPSFVSKNTSIRSMRSLMLLIKFYDAFFFTEDLEKFSEFLLAEKKERMFYSYLKNKILIINDDFGKILDVIESESLVDCSTISKLTKLPLSKVKKLISGQKANLKSLGIIEDLGGYYKISERFSLCDSSHF